MNHSIEIMPPALKTFLYYLLDDGVYGSVNKEYDIPINKVLRCMALAECILSIKKTFFFTPFHLDLLQMHHIYGHTFDNY